MPTTRPVDMEEARRMQESCDGRWAMRDRCLIELGIRCGFRISEMLSLRLNDVLEPAGGDAWRLRERLTVTKSRTKGKVATRSVILHPRAAAVLRLWVADLGEQGYWRGETFLFQSAWPASGNRPITRARAWQIVRQAAERIGSRGCVATHSLRKTAVGRIYEHSGHDLIKTQKFSGHKDLNSLRAYLQVDQEDVDALVLSLD